jgi:DNA-binding transcriptional MerR regulator
MNNDAIIQLPQDDEDRNFTTAELAQYFGRSAQTIRNWSDGVQKFLSTYATAADGRNRTYTITDIQILKLVADQREKDQPMDSIIASLHASYDAETNTFTDLPDITQEDVEMNLELDERSMQKFQITLLHHELAEKVEEIERLRGAELRAEKLATQVEERDARIAELIKTATELREQIEELQEERVASARREGEAYYRGRLDQAIGKNEDKLNE